MFYSWTLVVAAARAVSSESQESPDVNIFLLTLRLFIGELVVMQAKSKFS